VGVLTVCVRDLTTLVRFLTVFKFVFLIVCLGVYTVYTVYAYGDSDCLCGRSDLLYEGSDGFRIWGFLTVVGFLTICVGFLTMWVGVLTVFAFGGLCSDFDRLLVVLTIFSFRVSDR